MVELIFSLMLGAILLGISVGMLIICYFGCTLVIDDIKNRKEIRCKQKA